MTLFEHIRRHEGLEKRIMEGCIPGREGDQKGDGFRISHFAMGALDAGYLAYDRVIFRRVVKGTTEHSFC
jgi:hypothetical protein